MEEITQLLQALYLLLPGAVANMAPVLVKKIPLLDYPLDFNQHLNGKPILGTHKTFRGLLSGILAAVIIVKLQTYLLHYTFFQEISLFNYAEGPTLTFGSLIGTGVILGDAAKSFFKRRLGIPAGEHWYPFDQVDSLAGAFILAGLVYIPPLSTILIIAILVPLLHLGVNALAYHLRLKDVAW